MDWLTAFYAAVGKHPLRLSRELPGFVGNRLQEAMWREALHMVAAGEATVEEMYRDDEVNQFLEVTYQNGDKEVMYYKDFASGAMIER